MSMGRKKSDEEASTGRAKRESGGRTPKTARVVTGRDRPASESNVAHSEALIALTDTSTGDFVCDGFTLSIQWDPNQSGVGFALGLRSGSRLFQIVTGPNGPEEKHALIRQFFALMAMKWPGLGWRFDGKNGEVTG